MKNWPDGYLEKIEEILGDSFVDGELKLILSIDNEAEAKLHIKKLSLMQKQLRQIKKQSNQNKERIRSDYGDQIKGVDAGLFSSIFGGAGSERESKRRTLRKQRDNEILRYDKVNNTIDEIYLQFDSLKLQIETIIQKGEY